MNSASAARRDARAGSATSIFAKLQVENRAQAIVPARKAGFGGE
jgi:hypothetical protein